MRSASNAPFLLDERVFAEQVRSLYSSTWASRYTPFAALVVLLAVNWSKVPLASAILVIVSHAIATAALDFARTSYAKAPEARPTQEWARIFAGLSALAGATWMFATVVWFVPGDYVNQALLSLVILAISTASMIGRFPHLPSLGIHLVLSMGPLIAMLALEGTATPTFTASLGFLYALFLYGWARKFNRSQAETLRLRARKAELISELRAANEAAEAARIAAEQGREAAEAGARAKSQFLATVSHEIRTPLNAIIGMSELLCRSELSGAQRDAAETVREAGGALKLIVDDIIDLSRIEAGKLSIESGVCNVRNLVETITGTVASRASEKGLTLSAEVSEQVPAQIESDARCLRQILINLVGNAIKFTERGRVGISLTTAGERLRCEVTDTGTGIPQHKLDRLFTPFSQVDQSYSRQHGGTGLGLAICRRMVQLLGGEIGVNSEPGRGSTFWFEIPLVAASAPDMRNFSQGGLEANHAEPPQDDALHLVDTAQIARLGLSLGESTLMDVLGSYLEIETKILAELERAVESGDAQAAARAGQDLASASADLGLLKLSIASRALAQRAREPYSTEAIAAEADSLRREAARTHQTLVRLFPELRAKA